MFTESSKPRDWQQQVAVFMREVKGLELPTKPRHPAQLTRRLCVSLIVEEYAELINAMVAEDIVEVADGIADLLYVTLYTANCYGLNMEPIFAEVQRSNMTKKGGSIRSDGKQLKGASYSPPNIKSMVEAQKNG